MNNLECLANIDALPDTGTGNPDAPYAILRVRRCPIGNFYEITREDIHWLAANSNLSELKIEWLVQFVQPRMNRAEEADLPQYHEVWPMLLEIALAAARLHGDTIRVFWKRQKDNLWKKLFAKSFFHTFFKNS